MSEKKSSLIKKKSRWGGRREGAGRKRLTEEEEMMSGANPNRPLKYYPPEPQLSGDMYVLWSNSKKELLASKLWEMTDETMNNVRKKQNFPPCFGTGILERGSPTRGVTKKLLEGFWGDNPECKKCGKIDVTFHTGFKNAYGNDEVTFDRETLCIHWSSKSTIKELERQGFQFLKFKFGLGWCDCGCGERTESGEIYIKGHTYTNENAIKEK